MKSRNNTLYLNKLSYISFLGDRVMAARNDIKQRIEELRPILDFLKDFFHVDSYFEAIEIATILAFTYIGCKLLEDEDIAKKTLYV